MAKLIDVCDFQGGTQPPKNEWIDDPRDGYVRMLQIRDYTQGDSKFIQYVLDTTKLHKCKEDDIMLSRYGYIGQAFMGLSGAYNVALVKVIKKIEIDTKYLLYYFQSQYFQHFLIDNVGSRATIPGFNKSELVNAIIPVRTAAEQHQIAANLDKVTHTIDLCNNILEKLDLLVKARFVEMTQSDKSVIPTRMGDIASYINGYAFKPTDWTETGNPIIRIQNLNDLAAKFNFYSGELDEKYAVSDGDILVSWATHLEAYIWNRGDAWLNQHIFKAVFDKMTVNKIYFVYATEEALRQAFKNAHGFKPTMEHIKRSDFENAIVQLPSLETQNQFAAFVEQTDKSKSAVKQVLEKAETLKKALMQEYFG